MSDKTEVVVAKPIQEDVIVYDEERIALLKDTLMPPKASDTELQLFINICQRTKLDPFSRQIYPIARWDSGKKKEVISFQCSIDGFRVIAERAGDYAGQVGPFWCGDDSEWKDVWLAKTPPQAAKVGVLRHSFTEPLWAVARYDEYVQTDSKGNVTRMWRNMPANQLAKCAEALALRRAFPNDLSGLYASEEMDQSENPKSISDTDKKGVATQTGNATEDILNELDGRADPVHPPAGDDNADATTVHEEKTTEADTPATEPPSEEARPLTERDKEEIKRKEKIEARTEKMKKAIDSGDLNVNQQPSRQFLVEILRARGFTDDQLASNFKVHIHGKYNADQWTKLNKKQQQSVIQDAVDGEIDEPVPF